MLKASLRLDGGSDVAKLMGALTRRASRQVADPVEKEAILERTRLAIDELTSQGRKVIRIGGQLNATRIVDGPGYSIRVEGRFGTKDSIAVRCFRMVKGFVRP